MQAQEPRGLALKARIELPNVNGRIDHFSADVKGQRLFMAALGNHTVEVMDIQGGKRIHTMPDLAEPQGIYFDSATNRLFVACAKDGTTKIFDGGTFQLLETVKFSGDADNIRYDPRSRRIIVGYGDGALGFLDTNGKKTGEIALDAHPESFQLEAHGRAVYANVPPSNLVVAFDKFTGNSISNTPFVNCDIVSVCDSTGAPSERAGASTSAVRFFSGSLSTVRGSKFAS